MIGKKIIAIALVVAVCSFAFLTACSNGKGEGKHPSDNKVSADAGSHKGPIDAVVDGVQNGVDSVENDLMNNAEEATHAERNDLDESARDDGHSHEKGDANGAIAPRWSKDRKHAPQGK